MLLTVALNREFIPKWNSNDKAPVAEQIKIQHKSPTVSIKEKVFPKKFEFGADGEVRGSFDVDRKRLIAAFAPTFVNLAYMVDDGKEVVKKVATVEQLFEAPSVFDGLIDELYNYFQELLNEKVDTKN
jgi:hypothetical protein